MLINYKSTMLFLNLYQLNIITQSLHVYLYFTPIKLTTISFKLEFEVILSCVLLSYPPFWFNLLIAVILMMRIVLIISQFSGKVLEVFLVECKGNILCMSNPKGPLRPDGPFMMENAQCIRGTLTHQEQIWSDRIVRAWTNFAIYG